MSGDKTVTYLLRSECFKKCVGRSISPSLNGLGIFEEFNVINNNMYLRKVIKFPK